MKTYASCIDSAILNSTTLNTSTSELGQLAKLLSSRVISEIFRLNNEFRSKKTVNFSSEITVVWIDKIPLAKMHNALDYFGQPITQRVELGDALFIDINNSGNKRASAFLFQAKRAKSLKLPTVPVYMGCKANNSSLKELALLNKWPIFDLYQTSGSGKSESKNIKIKYPSVPSPHGWFGVCPPSLTGHDWKAHWMCAAAQHGEKFNLTMGELLESFYLKNGLQVGCDYVPNSRGDSWQELIEKILKIAGVYNTPSTYSYVYGENRVKTPLPFRLHNNGLIDIWVDNIFDKIHHNTNTIRISSLTADNFKRKMPLIIYRSFGELKESDNLEESSIE
ncbi:hypothetical protein ACK3Z2_00850 [Aeromonas caviae]